MKRRYDYPPELADYVRAHWPAGQSLRLSPEALAEALSVAYEASLTSEEARPTRFRLLLTNPDDLPERGRPNEGVLRLRFADTRPLNADELRSLSPSAPFEASLIGTHATTASCGSGAWRTRGRRGSRPPGEVAAWSRTGRTIRSCT